MRPLAFLVLAVPAALHAQASVVLRGATLARLRAQVPNAAALHVVAGSQPTAVTAAADTVVVHPGAFLTYRVGSSPATHPKVSASGAPAHVDTPLRVVSVDAKGSVRVNVLTFWPDSGLNYDPVTDQFSGTFQVWLEDQEDGSEHTLPQPVTINVFSQADLSSTAVKFTGSGTPQHVKVVIRSPGDTVRVQLWPQAKIDSVSVPMRVSPALRVHVTPRGVDGWGLETATATVQLLGDAHGEYGVTVRPTMADPQTFTLTHRGARTAVLRSRGMGTDTVRAEAAGAASGLDVVTYGLPFDLLIALVFGSAVGTWALLLTARKAGHKQSSRTTFWAFARGTLLGIVAVAAYAVGVKAIPIPIPAQVGEGGAFVVSSLAAYLGLRRR